ncbi:cation diffusion facilitator family transporter [Parasediminibacterium sp. JCM 36343]|uniref:cation diffusion facilitator family transporter n=1 Tax=Parasediminibacterium sp. JCM 36343 TaxID=3374279 RepID=UPI00397CD825
MAHHHEHNHTHDHDHSHGHHHHEVTNINTAFIVGIILNTAFVIVELVIGYSSSSLALISDAGHNATDVFSLILSMFAFKLAKSKATPKYTYGYKRATILNSLFNAILLLIVTGGIIWEGFYRLEYPVHVQGKLISIIAFAGIFVNGISAWLFFKDKESDINIKGAYLHLLSDMLVAFGVVVAGVVIYFTNWFWIDTAISFVIAVIILISTWQLLADSIRLALDGVPRDIDMKKVEATLLKFAEVKNVHHIHVWALSSKQNALTAHLVIEDDFSAFEKRKHQIKHALEHLGIQHATFEIETAICQESLCEN